MPDDETSLSELLVNEDELNEELLVNTLQEYIGIGNESGSLIPKAAFHEMNSKQKITIVLLSQKARYELGLAEDEWLTPSEISGLSGIKKGTVYPTVRELDSEELVVSEDGKYKIPAYSIERARSFIQDS